MFGCHSLTALTLSIGKPSDPFTTKRAEAIATICGLDTVPQQLITMEASPTCDYALGSTDAEHERLIWQGEHLAPHTERLFRESGIGEGQRVLDIGSGVGDVALLAVWALTPTRFGHPRSSSHMSTSVTSWSE